MKKLTAALILVTGLGLLLSTSSFAQAPHKPHHRHHHHKHHPKH